MEFRAFADSLCPWNRPIQNASYPCGARYSIKRVVQYKYIAIYMAPFLPQRPASPFVSPRRAGEQYESRPLLDLLFKRVDVLHIVILVQPDRHASLKEVVNPAMHCAKQDRVVVVVEDKPMPF